MNAPCRCCCSCIAESLERALDHLPRGNVAIAVRMLVLAIEEDMHNDEQEFCRQGRLNRARYVACGGGR